MRIQRYVTWAILLQNGSKRFGSSELDITDHTLFLLFDHFVFDLLLDRGDSPDQQYILT